LGDPYNWYEAGDLSPEEASEAFRVIVQDAPYNERTCPNPAGGKIFRINASGKTEELGDAGEWQDPTGDATIPPIPPREGSDPDIICLAAKNAANVLQLLYENITDSFNTGLDEAEAATALTLTLVGLIGAEFAPITFALVTFFAIVFSVLYGVLEFVGADLWDEAFTNNLICILRDCASADAGVVTFDWECFQAALAAQTNVFSLTFEQLRLFGQIEYLLLVIGGIDALNTAGATTAITDDVCDCGCPENYKTCLDFTLSDYGVAAGLGTWVEGEGFVFEDTSDGAGHFYRGVWLSFAILSGNVAKITVEFTGSAGTYVAAVTDRIYKDSDLSGNWLVSGTSLVTSPFVYTGDLDGATALGVTLTCGFSNPASGSLTVTQIIVEGEGCSVVAGGVDCL